jgi:hypothetical protein
MIVAKVQLVRNYSPGMRYVQTNDLTDILLQLDAVPSRATLYSRANPAVNTTYAVASVGGGMINLGAVLAGTDRAYVMGDLVGLQTNMADASLMATVPPPVIPPGTSGTINCDLSQGSIFEPAALTGATTIGLLNAGARPTFTVSLIPGGQALTWGFSPLWPGGVAPTPTITAGKIDTFSFLYRPDKSAWYAYVVAQNS